MKCIVALLFLLSIDSAFSSGRTDRRFGVYAAFGEPTASLIGGNVGFNAFNFLRLHAGYGVTTLDANTLSSYGVAIPAGYAAFGNSVSVSVRNIGVGAQLLVPGWTLTPVAGLKYISSSAVLNAFGISLPLINATTFVAEFGLDWQTSVGFYVAGGWQIPVSSSLSLLVGVGSPYVCAGWYF